MEISMSARKKQERGFSVVEVIIAVSILSVGLLAIAALLANLTSTTTSSRYTGTQTLLAAEKLEDLNRLSACDAQIAVPLGNTSGSLTADVNQVVNASATVCGTKTVNYFDDVSISSDNGAIVETNNGATIAQTPDGEMKAVPPPASSDMIRFHRRWIIEQSQPVPGARRITVLVTLQTGSVTDRASTFQTSMVRQ
jgi:prepilin-type N-terminal cleavage/methylation domain-containing protein